MKKIDIIIYSFFMVGIAIFITLLFWYQSVISFIPESLNAERTVDALLNASSAKLALYNPAVFLRNKNDVFSLSSKQLIVAGMMLVFFLISVGTILFKKKFSRHCRPLSFMPNYYSSPSTLASSYSKEPERGEEK